jgi:hypothetical protein
MSLSLTVYPLAEKDYNGGREAADHALYYRMDCPMGLEEAVRKLPKRETGKLTLNFAPDSRDRYCHSHGNHSPLFAVKVHDLAKILDKYTTDDRQSRSYAVVAFLKALPADVEAVPYFN